MMRVGGRLSFYPTTRAEHNYTPLLVSFRARILFCPLEGVY